MADAFDLDAFLPAPISFKARGQEYRLDGDPDVDTVARMLQAETRITDAAQLPAEQRVDAIVEATAAGKHLIADMILEHDASQDTAGLKLSTQDVLTVFALVMHGGSVAAVVAEAMSVPGSGTADDEESVATAESDADGEGVGGVGPLRSASGSSERSSSSDIVEDGALPIGSA